MPRDIPLSHPGEILLEEWLKPLNISADAVPPRCVHEIIQGKRSISADTALRLAAFFQTDAQSWLNLQNHYDTEQVREKIAATLAHIPAYNAAILNS